MFWLMPGGGGAAGAEGAVLSELGVDTARCAQASPPAKANSRDAPTQAADFFTPPPPGFRALRLGDAGGFRGDGAVIADRGARRRTGQQRLDDPLRLGQHRLEAGEGVLRFG